MRSCFLLLLLLLLFLFLHTSNIQHLFCGVLENTTLVVLTCGPWVCAEKALVCYTVRTCKLLELQGPLAPLSFFVFLSISIFVFLSFCLFVYWGRVTFFFFKNWLLTKKGDRGSVKKPTSYIYFFLQTLNIASRLPVSWRTVRRNHISTIH